MTWPAPTSACCCLAHRHTPTLLRPALCLAMTLIDEKPVVVNGKIRLAYSLLAAFAFLLISPTDFPLRHTHHKVVYDEDDHDVCRYAPRDDFRRFSHNGCFRVLHRLWVNTVLPQSCGLVVWLFDAVVLGDSWSNVSCTCCSLFPLSRSFVV